MARKVILSIVAAASICAALAPAASAASPIRLYLGQGAAFSILGHSCGGIQEKVYATGFAAKVSMSSSRVKGLRVSSAMSRARWAGTGPIASRPAATMRQ